MQGRPGQLEAVQQRPGVGALVRADGAGLVVLDPDPGEDAVAAVGVAVGRGVVLGHRPDRGLGVGDQHALRAPGVDRPRRLLVGVALGVAVGVGRVERFRQVDRDRVVGRARQQPRPLGGVDHVVGRRRDRVQRADLVEVVVERVERAHVGHRAES